ncbi:MAG TPA: hypothetical protein VFD30_08935, partial [Terriglobia bacterium]|nr:hypothetical protein [Terriglobia bacterium]
MKRLVPAITCLYLAVSAPQLLQATTYYVDSAAGNDANSGQSSSAPWKTLAKVNSVALNPGDSVLFKRG